MHQHFKRLVPKGEYIADHSLHWKMLMHFHDAPKLVKLLRINKQYELNKKLNQISVNKATKKWSSPTLFTNLLHQCLPQFKLESKELADGHWKTNPKESDLNPHKCILKRSLKIFSLHISEKNFFTKPSKDPI